MSKQIKNIESTGQVYGLGSGNSAMYKITESALQYTGAVDGDTDIHKREVPVTQNNMSATVRSIHVAYFHTPASVKYTAGAGNCNPGIQKYAYALRRTLFHLLKYIPVKLFHAGVSREFFPETKKGSSLCMNYMSESISRMPETLKCVPDILKSLLKAFRQYPACPVQLLMSMCSFPVSNREIFWMTAVFMMMTAVYLRTAGV